MNSTMAETMNDPLEGGRNWDNSGLRARLGGVRPEARSIEAELRRAILQRQEAAPRSRRRSRRAQRSASEGI